MCVFFMFLHMFMYVPIGQKDDIKCSKSFIYKSVSLVSLGKTIQTGVVLIKVKAVPHQISVYSFLFGWFFCLCVVVDQNNHVHIPCISVYVVVLASKSLSALERNNGQLLISLTHFPTGFAQTANIMLFFSNPIVYFYNI